jgi:CHAT domain-containing protein/tetratricopeptide (TPR) repeat protein
MKRCSLVSWVFLFVSALLSTSASAQVKPGVVVERVEKDSPGERAGLKEGDLLLAWSRGEAGGKIESPFDVLEIAIEQEGRGKITLVGSSNNRPKEWNVDPDRWGLKVRPRIPQELAQVYKQSQALRRAGRFTDQARVLRAAVIRHDRAMPAWAYLWLLAQAAEAFEKAHQWSLADETYQQAIERAEGRSLAIRGQLLLAWTKLSQRRSHPCNESAQYVAFISQSEESGAESLTAAALLSGLASSCRLSSDLEKAERYAHQALEIRRRLVPGSLNVAASLDNLGDIALDRSDFRDAESFYGQALQIQRKLAPKGLDTAVSLNGLGDVARTEGNLIEAAARYRQALELQQQLAPGSLDLAVTFANLAEVAWQREDWAAAEKYYRRAFVLLQELAPATLDFASCLNNLGNAARKRKDLATAERLHRRALDLQQKLAPGSLNVAVSFESLGDIAYDRRDLAKAERFYQQALEIQRKLSPGDVLLSLEDLAGVALDQGDSAKAERYLQESVDIRGKLNPTGEDYARSVATLAFVFHKEGQLERAEWLYAQALNVLEKQMTVFGGTEEGRSNVRAKYIQYHKNYIDLLTSQGRLELALQSLERSRARTLLEMLTSAHVDVHPGVDRRLLERERSIVAGIRTETNRRIQLMNTQHTEGELAAINGEIENLLAQHGDVEEQIEAASPSYAGLAQPQALSSKELQQLLDEETVLLEYSLDEQRSYVFVLTQDSLHAYVLPKKSQIEEAARRVYELVTAHNHERRAGTELAREQRLAQDDAGYSQAAMALAQMVLAPIPQQTGKKRFLVVADGALQYIPFSLLPMPSAWNAAKVSHSGLITPFIAEYEIVALPSASTLVALRQQVAGRREAPKAVAILADPVFTAEDSRVREGAQRREAKPSGVTASPRSNTMPSEDTPIKRLTRSANDVGLSLHDQLRLPRLLFTHQEAKAIAATTPPGETLIATDFKASRETAASKELAQYRIVHFATHGLLDSQHPELSGLVLSMVDERGKRQNGYLSLEDIYTLNLPADLVVLSACQTGLGKEIDGEGLIGLTRGFMYAGAARVMASMWKVDDVAAAELMGRFYRAMEKEGMRPAAALRKAQIEMWQQQRWRSPYYWATFQIHGEWK